MRAPVLATACVVVTMACGCGGKVQVGEHPIATDAGPDAGPVMCVGEACGAGEICKYEAEDLDASPCCGKCMGYDGAPPDRWTCDEAEEYCRIACLAAEWPYVWCEIE